MVTPRAIRTEIENALAYLIGAEIALYTNPVIDEHGRVTWRSARPVGKFMRGRALPTALDYRHWIDVGAYSALLMDGSLLQLSYDFAGNDLVGHRLAYVPCPFNVDRDLLELEPPVDVFDLYAGGHTSEVILRTVIRFDFDLESTRPEHPATHLTINSPDCRIGCVAPLGVGRFIDFIFRPYRLVERLAGLRCVG